MGSMQRLPNGNTVIGWGGGIPPLPYQPVALTEFTAEADVALKLSFLDIREWSYRAFKFPWQGFPTTSPTLVAVTDTVPVTLYYSWNGATEVVSYTVYGGVTPRDLKVIAQQAKTDFEDSTPVESAGSTLCFFQVIPSMQGNAAAIASELLYLGDGACENGLTVDHAQISSRSFTYPQSGGNVTATLTVLPDDATSPTIFIHTPFTAGVASVPAGQIISPVRFGLQAFQGDELHEITVLNKEVQIAIDYGALDLSRGPADVNLLRWDETTQSWTDAGLTLLQREVVGQRVTYALHQTGEFALFVTNQAPQSASVSTLIDEDESLSFSADLFPYFDVDGDAFDGLLIGTLPVSGSLTYSGTPVMPSQVITAGMLSLLQFTPEADAFGLPYTSFDYRVTDSFTQSVAYSFTIAVAPVNDAPVANDDQIGSVAVSANAPDAEQVFTIPLPVLANDVDVDGDRLQIVSVTNPAHGTAVISGELIIYRSFATYEGSDSFTYTIDDGHGEQDTATVSVERSPNVQYLPRIGQR
jgi:hypothetical protein